VSSDDTVPPAHERDSHGVVATKNSRFIWLFDRGRAGELQSVVPISNIDSLGMERCDSHGIRVRRK
jgi:hypothetical protein